MQASKEFDASAPVAQAATYSSSKVRKLKCMFTTQVTKKRKAWSDGWLKVFFSGGTYQCSLIDCSKIRETSLVSRQLEVIEVQKLKRNEEIELEFEGYLVTVLAGNEYDETKVGPPLKLPKFVPPSAYVPVNRTPLALPVQRVLSSSSHGSAGPYKVTTEELDDLWDRETPTAAMPHATGQSVKPGGIGSAMRDAGRDAMDGRPSQYPQRMQHGHREEMEHVSARYQQHQQQQQQHQRPYTQQGHPQPPNHDGSQRSIDEFFPSTSANNRVAPGSSIRYQDNQYQRSAHNAPQHSEYGVNMGEPHSSSTGGSRSALAANKMHTLPAQHSSDHQYRHGPAAAPASVPQVRPSNAVLTQVVSQHKSSSAAGGTENQARGNGAVYNNTNTVAPAKPEYSVRSAVAAPVQKAADYQPTGYSTIIGSSVWDSD